MIVRTRRRGFTLVEILIVVMILAIFASIVIPRYTAATDESRRATVVDQLRMLREQVQIYKAEHAERLPGTTAALPAGNATLFFDQLTSYTNADGGTSATRDATHRLGPYLPSVPPNPISDLNTVKFDLTLDPVPTADGTTGWIFQPLTGRLSINLGAQDASGKTYVSY